MGRVQVELGILGLLNLISSFETLQHFFFHRRHTPYSSRECLFRAAASTCGFCGFWTSGVSPTYILQRWQHALPSPEEGVLRPVEAVHGVFENSGFLKCLEGEKNHSFQFLTENQKIVIFLFALPPQGARGSQASFWEPGGLLWSSKCPPDMSKHSSRHIERIWRSHLEFPLGKKRQVSNQINK